MATKRDLIEKFDERLNYGGAYAERRDGYETPIYDPQTGDLIGATYHPPSYAISFHQGLMPPYATTNYATIDNLLTAMRAIAPLSHWRTVRMDD